ncbi:MAG: hypothetical protein K6F64_00050 [Clostridia bacterium]|nr:hypothetical protein [Clostridia bacterium]
MKRLTMTVTALCITAVLMTFFLLPIGAVTTTSRQSRETESASQESVSQESTESTAASDSTAESLTPSNNRQSGRTPPTAAPREPHTAINPSDAVTSTTGNEDSSTSQTDTSTTQADSSTTSGDLSSTTAPSVPTTTKAYDMTTYRSQEEPLTGDRPSYTTVSETYEDIPVYTDDVQITYETYPDSDTSSMQDTGVYVDPGYYSGDESSSQDVIQPEKPVRESKTLYAILGSAVGILLLVSASSFIYYRKSLK